MYSKADISISEAMNTYRPQYSQESQYANGKRIYRLLVRRNLYKTYITFRKSCNQKRNQSFCEYLQLYESRKFCSLQYRQRDSSHKAPPKFVNNHYNLLIQEIANAVVRKERDGMRAFVLVAGCLSALVYRAVADPKNDVPRRLGNSIVLDDDAPDNDEPFSDSFIEISDYPSMTPSMSPSSAPTIPSNAPSDYPSVGAMPWIEDEYDAPEGYEVCGLSESVNFDTLRTISVIYTYKLGLEDGVQLDSVGKDVEATIEGAVKERSCGDGSGTPKQAHAVSVGEPDLPVGKENLHCVFRVC